ncbi:hypothetical protein C8R47DRAFT_1096452 [Mycena vitilis]|nr:hypothetical protein C8R47DRAFT_1096452 [Mycena vitilis]
MCLPAELVHCIFAFLPDNADLAVAARASAFLSPIALRVLYRDLSIAESSAHAPPSVVHTLAKRPDIARHVRFFAVSLDAATDVFHSSFTTALSAMTALVSLDIFMDADTSILPSNLVYPQLQRFASSFPFDSRVAAFFDNAPALQSAQVESSQSPLSLARTSLPRLAEFTGCASAAVAVVPGRPVESIYISGDLTEDLVPAFAKSTAPVTILSITTSSAPLLLLQVLGQHLPHIMYLRITSTCNLPAPPSTVSRKSSLSLWLLTRCIQIFYEQVAEALAFFPELQSFELSGMYWSSSKQTDDTQRTWQRPFSLDLEPHQEEEVLDLYSNAADFFFS